MIPSTIIYNTLTSLPSLAVGHVIQHIFHGAAVWEGALSDLSVSLVLPSLALMCMK